MSTHPPRRAKSAKTGQDWIVYRIGGARAGKIGHVTAADEREAIAKAIREFDVAPSDRARLIAQRVG